MKKDDPFMTIDDYNDLVERYDFINFTSFPENERTITIVAKSGTIYRGTKGPNNMFIHPSKK